MSIETYQSGHGNGLAVPQQPTALALRPSTVSRLHDWAQSAQAAHEVATSLVQTSFVPEAFRNKPHEATAAILAGDEVGLSPMASLRAFDIIQGTAAPRAITHRAVVQSRGHAIWLAEHNATRAIVRGRRAGESEIQESEWTIQRARSLGLTNKHNWKVQPEAMLIARATSECCRLVASDALMGMPYSAEELYDEGPQQPEEQPAPRTAQRRSRAALPAPAPTPASTSGPPATTGPPPPSAPGAPPLPGEDGYDDDPTGSATDWDALIEQYEAAGDRPQLTALWRKARAEIADDGELLARITEAGMRVKAAQDAAPPSEHRMKLLFALLGDRGVKRKEMRLAFATHLLERDIASYDQLTTGDVTALIAELERLNAESPASAPADTTEPPAQQPEQPTDTEGEQ